jgi:hypothetical protein
VLITTIGSDNSTAMNPNFSGFNDWNYGATQYNDPEFNGLSDELTPGFIRYPTGMAGLAFDWQTGRDNLDWAKEFTGDPVERLYEITTYAHLGKKYGSPFYEEGDSSDYSFVHRIDHAYTAVLSGGTTAPSIIFTFNALTDNNALNGNPQNHWKCLTNAAMPNSASCLADLVIQKNLPVKVYELAQEPYYFATCTANCSDMFGIGRWQTALNYLAWVQPSAKSISTVYANEHAGVPNIAIYAQDAGTPRNDNNGGTEPYLWDKHIAEYVASHSGAVYWNTIAYHQYTKQTSCLPSDTETQCFQKWMTDEDAQLAFNTVDHVKYLDSLNLFGAGQPHQYEITEFNPSGGATVIGKGTTMKAGVDSIVFKARSGSLTNGTEYGGVFAAEYVMRMSGVPEVHFVGMQSLQFKTAIDVTNNELKAVYDCGFSHTGCTDDNGTDIDARRYDRNGASCSSDPSTCFGFFITAQGLGIGLANGVVNTTHDRYTTKLEYPAVAHKPPALPVVTPRVGSAAGGSPATVDAVYAQAYGDGVGADARHISILLTNKNKFPVTITVKKDSASAYKGDMHVRSLSAPFDRSAENGDGTKGALAPYAKNVPPNETNPIPGCEKTPTTCVSLTQRTPASNPIVLPAYSVMRVDLY